MKKEAVLSLVTVPLETVELLRPQYPFCLVSYVLPDMLCSFCTLDCLLEGAVHCHVHSFHTLILIPLFSDSMLLDSMLKLCFFRPRKQKRMQEILRPQ
uniref:Uncharacterized protein n=1 Tax=Arundo donax TaxID=35708 RepID=A0A0A9DNU7_ARUDO